MLLAFSVILACVLIITAVLVCSSRAKPAPLLDKTGKPRAGSLSEKTFVKINGVQQGMIIKSKDVSKPVLLILHGGPGMPIYFLDHTYPTGLEDDFTVCWWDQRGAGLSYDPSAPLQALTVEQLIADTLEVTNYLRQRFGKEKIYLMGHSWGSFLGIQAAARAPQLYFAYIGVGQVSYQHRSEKLSYDYMLQKYRENGDTTMLRKLEKAPVTLTDKLPDAYMALRDEAMHKIGVGTTHTMKSVVSGIFIPSLQNRDYTLLEKINIWRGKITSRRILWDEFIDTDLTSQVPEIDIPVYFFHGVYDYTVAYPLAKAYFARLNAPLKGFYTFNHSAHSPQFEEAGKTRLILQQDVLAGTNNLADMD